MPFWQIFHPVDAYSPEDKKKFAERIVDLYTRIPRFYVVTLFEPIPADSYFVGGLSHPSRSTRWQGQCRVRCCENGGCVESRRWSRPMCATGALIGKSKSPSPPQTCGHYRA
jgi:phenylpyruvate tautomerase PptA (4-oxalocrotonate tautomerase family)